MQFLSTYADFGPKTELLAVGIAQQAIVDFESLCALEILLARPDVDPTRIGMTGASGGGYNSWIVPSLDPRIAALARDLTAGRSAPCYADSALSVYTRHPLATRTYWLRRIHCQLLV